MTRQGRTPVARWRGQGQLSRGVGSSLKRGKLNIQWRRCPGEPEPRKRAKKNPDGSQAQPSAGSL